MLIVLCDCSFEELRGDFRPTGHEAFSIEQAKEFFERDFAEQLTKSGGKMTLQKEMILMKIWSP